jgi:putative NIF3 family GTP cyclohydrolase 1 type 2
MTERATLELRLNQWLEPARFKDYGPNGLQVEGRTEVRRLVCGVTASLALIDAAIAADADAVLVHHGLFWRGQDGRVTGWMKRRLARLLQHDINLFAYHLPLDAHPALGNNAQLGARLGWTADGRFGDQDLGFTAAIEPTTLEAVAAQLRTLTGREVTAGPAAAPRRLVHGRRPGLFRSSHRGGRRCFRHWRDLRAAGPLRPRDRRRLSRCGPPCDRALWRAGRR